MIRRAVAAAIDNVRKSNYHEMVLALLLVVFCFVGREPSAGACMHPFVGCAAVLAESVGRCVQLANGGAVLGDGYFY